MARRGLPNDTLGVDDYSRLCAEGEVVPLPQEEVDKNDRQFESLPNEFRAPRSGIRGEVSRLVSRTCFWAADHFS